MEWEAEGARALNRLVALAALMYCGHCLRDIPLSHAVFRNGVSRLKTAVEGYQPPMWDALDLDFDFRGKGLSTRKLFWVLFFGAVAAEGKSERAWFVRRMGMCAADLGLWEWQEAREVMESVLWQSELDANGMRVWGEILVMRDTLESGVFVE